MIDDIPQSLIHSVNDVLEARRNPDQNPKIGPYTRLKEYADDPSIFISFTAIDKIGINPTSEYRTPLGIYTYPLKVAWEYYRVKGYWLNHFRKSFSFDNEIDDSLSAAEVAKKEQEVIERAFPFATRNPYIQVLKSKIPLTDLQDFTLRNVTVNTANDIREIIENSKGTNQEKLKAQNSLNNLIELIESKKAKPHVDTPGGLFWWLTLHCSNPKISYDDISHVARLMQKHYKSKNSMRVWNYLLRELNHIGFIDRGEAIIHDHEPTQAVFLSTKGFTLVDKIMNKPNVLSKKKVKKGSWMNDNKISDDAYYIYHKEFDAYTWYKGTFFNGTWRSRRNIWHNGTWKGGTWKGGTWYDGTWEKGKWVDGNWLGGDWLGGNWLGGFIYSHKFETFLRSKINPNEFYEAEANAETVEKLQFLIGDQINLQI